MDQALNDWKLAVERCWSADAPDWQETAQLVAGIAASSENLTLRQAAAQALPDPKMLIEIECVASLAGR